MNKESRISSNPIIKLMRIVGSPFVSGQEQELSENKNEALELYTYATKNKIGLLYLEALKKQEKLEEFGLKSEYHEECEKHNKQLITTSRISKLLNSAGINYVIFKSIMPYPAVPNDVDILHFGSADDYKKALEMIPRSGYIRMVEGSGPLTVMFHDTRDGKLVGRYRKDVYNIAMEDRYKKGVYDIDLYRKVAASYIVYLDKRKLEKYITINEIFCEQIKVLKPEAELVVMIAHAIIPEQICTLFVYYATLHHLVRMNSEEINRFIDITRENNVTFPVKAHCSLVAEVHQAAHGSVPEKIEEILTELGDEANEKNNLLKNNFKMPHHYTWQTVIRTLLEKAKEEEFRRSVVKQTVSMLKSPKVAKWVIWNLFWIRRRETY